MKKNKFSADTPLSALFRRTFHDDLRQVIDSWRPALVGCPPDVDALSLTSFCFDRRQLHAKRVYMDLIGLMERGALRPSLCGWVLPPPEFGCEPEGGNRVLPNKV